VDILDQIVERRIAEAALRGDFDQLPGAGRPLELDDDALVPAELRVAYRMLRNAGYVPDEVQLLAELSSAERLLGQALAEEERAAAAARVRLLLGRLGGARGLSLQAEARYFERLVERLGRPPG
jgi:hypothetical protein